MAPFGGEDSDLDDHELDSLSRQGVNRVVKETVTKKNVPVQRDLLGQILPGQNSYYEEIKRDVTFRPTHHVLNKNNLSHYVYPTNYEVRDYQYDIVNKALFQNVLCAIPTGMGKTFIASTVMLNFFLWTIRGKIIFMAPTRPLVAQQIKACLGMTGIPHDQTAILLDKTRKNREEIWDTKRVFFTTPQVVENDLKRGALNPKDIVCLVIDEAHRATGSYAYTNVVKFIDRFSTSYRILALTATPGTDLESVQEVIKNLDISKIEIRTEESMDIVKYMKRRIQEKIHVDPLLEMLEIVEQLGIAVLPVLRQAVELGIYENCDPAQINAFKAMQQSQKIVANPNIPEGIKWRNFFILQLLNHVGQMLKRINIYGIRTFYNYFSDKSLEFTTKYGMGKSTNKVAAEFYYHPILKNVTTQCEKMLADPKFLGHGKLRHVRDELIDFFARGKSDSRVIIFTELRESALEIVRCVDAMDYRHVTPHIFIGQAKGKEGFDEVSFTRNNKAKGRKKVDRLKRQEEDQQIEEEKKKRKKQEALQRESRRTGSSEEAQANGMTQKQQKEVIQKFKDGEYNVLVCTSIGEEGLDIGEVDLIICYDTTSSPIKNIQRMGRTGRKRDGRVILLFSSNESYKFDQAMKDYASLQKVITQDVLEYQKSDRIIPTEAKPQCRKQFLTISEEDQEVNDMDDSEEVIRFATDCMLGKQRKSKNRAKAVQSKKQKRFFMPDEVETGIITADKLVRKVKKPKKELPLLDNLENDSFELSSPIKSEFEGSQAMTTVAADAQLKPTDPLPLPDSPPSKREISPSQDARVPSLSPRRPARSNLKLESPPPVKVKAELFSPEPTTSDLVDAVSLGQKIDSNENCHSSPPSNRGGQDKIFSDFSKNNGGLLTPQEREYFQKYYSVNDTVAIDTLPDFSGHTKTAHIPHSTRNQGFLNLFQDMKKNEKTRIIEMNRTRCIARGIQNGVLNEAKELRYSNLHTVLQDNKIKPLSRENTQLEELDEILGSDSDF
ncbi:hypothetical protein ZYGR_0AV01600 [Zygosaccharomyces rouxii]|uniref:ATP-dependent DNA helicase n=1 Tax=Zygosaccharomyces rouxii TaxID=4956 RepID=A0A1Q3AIG1_ZYGRO|nr:hypothetical protein ZYGR_0AV01600 [Zygosaccharomyces rouxii]